MAILKGRGHGKLLLFGEHVILHGYPALGIGVPPSLELRARSLATPGVVFSDALQQGLKRYPHLLQQFEKAFLVAGRRWWGARGVSVTVQSSVPIGRGMGSSSSLSVAAAHLELYGKFSLSELTAHQRGEIWKRAHHFERTFHHTPSGIDTALALDAPLTIFRPNYPVRAENSAYSWRGESSPTERASLNTENAILEAAIVIIVLPRSKGAAELIGRLRHQVNQRPATQRIIHRLGSLTIQAVDHIVAGFPSASKRSQWLEELGQYANQAHQLLTALELNDPLGDQLLTQARRWGALGGKISGAGAGGAHWLIFDNNTAQRRALAAIYRQLRQLSHARRLSYQLYSGRITGSHWQNFRERHKAPSP